MIKGETKVASPMAGSARGSSSSYWLIVRNDNGWTEPLIIYLDGQEALPIFSFREEAELFIRLEAGGSWSVRETSAGELVSLLFGPYSCVQVVALDPLPEICDDEGMSSLVSVSRKDFARTLARELLGGRGLGVTSTPARRAGHTHAPKEARPWAWR
jgi:hypothetical protein